MSNLEVKRFWGNPLVLVCVFAIGYWIYTYHLEHALGFLPYGILLLCPLMHIFMHGGHGHGGHGNHHDQYESNQECDHNKQKENQNAR